MNYFQLDISELYEYKHIPLVGHPYGPITSALIASYLVISNLNKYSSIKKEHTRSGYYEPLKGPNSLLSILFILWILFILHLSMDGLAYLIYCISMKFV